MTGKNDGILVLVYHFRFVHYADERKIRHQPAGTAAERTGQAPKNDYAAGRNRSGKTAGRKRRRGKTNRPSASAASAAGGRNFRSLAAKTAAPPSNSRQRRRRQHYFSRSEADHLDCRFCRCPRLFLFYPLFDRKRPARSRRAADGRNPRRAAPYRRRLPAALQAKCRQPSKNRRSPARRRHCRSLLCRICSGKNLSAGAGKRFFRADVRYHRRFHRPYPYRRPFWH